MVYLIVTKYNLLEKVTFCKIIVSYTKLKEQICKNHWLIEQSISLWQNILYKILKQVIRKTMTNRKST